MGGTQMRMRKAVSLIEVLITVAILSGGIVFVFRAFTTSLSAANLSQNITLASLLAEDTFWQIGQMEKEKILQEISGANVEVTQNRDFNISYELSPTGVEGLNKLDVSVSWLKNKKDSYDCSFSAYLEPMN